MLLLSQHLITTIARCAALASLYCCVDRALFDRNAWHVGLSNVSGNHALTKLHRRQNTLTTLLHCIIKQVYVEPRTSALHTTLPAQPQLGRLQLSIDSRYAVPAAIDICCPRPGCGKRKTDVDRRDRRADSGTPDRYIDLAPHTVRAASTISDVGKKVRNVRWRCR